MNKFDSHCEECPQVGDVYVCANPNCPMTMLVVRTCVSDDPECVCLACCGELMVKAN